MKKALSIILVLAALAVGAFMFMPRNTADDNASEPSSSVSAPETESTSAPEEVSADTTPTDVEPAANEETFFGYTLDELYSVYESEYQTAELADAAGAYQDLDARIQGEVNGAAYTLYTSKEMATPLAHEELYLAWRDTYHPVEIEDTEVVKDSPADTGSQVSQNNSTAPATPEDSYDLPTPSPDSDIPIAPTAGGNLADGADTDESNISSSGNQDKIDTSNIKLNGSGNNVPAPSPDSDIQRNPDIGRGPSSNADTDKSNISSSGNQDKIDTSGITLHG